MAAYLLVDTAIGNAGDLDRAAFGFRFSAPGTQRA